MFLARHLRSLLMSESPPEIAQCSHCYLEVHHAAVRGLRWQSNLDIIFLLMAAVRVALSIVMLRDMCERLKDSFNLIGERSEVAVTCTLVHFRIESLRFREALSIRYPVQSG